MLDRPPRLGYSGFNPQRGTSSAGDTHRTKPKGLTVMNQITARHQFAEDFLLVAMNDQKTYLELNELVDKFYDSDYFYGLAEALEVWWSWKVEEMTNAVHGVGKATLALFISQFLNNWGIDTWQDIAEHLWTLAEERKGAN